MIRLTATLALIAALGLSACQPPAEAPADATPPPAAETPVQSTAEMPIDAPPQEEVVGPDDPLLTSPAEEPCVDAIGQAASASLVARCIAVSPATRPPCNAANPCAMIQGEIDRSCSQYGPDEAKPTECEA